MIVTWLGQSGYLFESDGQRLLIDPFYSNIVEQRQGIKRLIQPPLPIEALCPDLIFITHNHLDHFDPIALPVIHRMFPKAKVVGPQSVMQKARELNFEQSALIPLPAGQSMDYGPFGLRSVPAYHGDPLAVGLALTVEDKTIYISGDTLLTGTLPADIRQICPGLIDIVFIVINGRLGNMTLSEAVELVAELKPGLAIPMHYGMFEENTADPNEFASACQAIGQPIKLLDLGEPAAI